MNLSEAMQIPEAIISTINNRHANQARKIALDYFALEEEQNTLVNKHKEQLKNEMIGEKRFRELTDPIPGLLSDCRGEAIQAIMALKEEYNNAVDAWSMPSADKLHDDAKLLNGSVKLSKADLERLAEKHRRNPVMMSVIRGYADSAKMDFYTDFATPDTKKEAFSEMTKTLVGTIREPGNSMKRAFVESDKHFVGTVCNAAVLNSLGESDE